MWERTNTLKPRAGLLRDVLNTQPARIGLSDDHDEEI